MKGCPSIATGTISKTPSSPVSTRSTDGSVSAHGKQGPQRQLRFLGPRAPPRRSCFAEAVRRQTPISLSTTRSRARSIVISPVVGQAIASLMRPAFHPDATMAGYCQGLEYSGSIEHLFDWINANGPAPDINPRFARIEIFETIAIVHLEVQGWSGKLAGADSGISEVFTLLKREGQWLITQKTFHWHDT